MKRVRLKFLLILMMMPLMTYAHGEGVLLTVSMQLLSFVAFIVIMIVVKLSSKKKLLLAGIYAVATVLTLCICSTIPYGSNMGIVDFLILIVPIATILVAISKLKKNQG